MKKIPITGGGYALVDNEDYQRLSRFKWHWKEGYARRNANLSDSGIRTMIFMHQDIVDIPTGMEIDHRSGNRSDNRKHNLRVVTSTQNKWNRGKNKNNTIGYKGVVLDKRSGYYYARIMTHRKFTHLGRFDTPEEAAKAYKKAEQEQHAGFTRN